MRSYRSWFGFVLAALALLIWSCEGSGLLPGGDLGVNQNLPVFNVDLFEDNIRNAFTGSSVGFAYAISVDGTLQRSDGVGDGLAAPDGNRSIEADDKMHIASVSKTITTAAMLRLIEDTPGLGLGTPITAYLPSGWSVGPGVTGVTFRDLLLHQAGFSYPVNQSIFTNRDLSAMIATGVVDNTDPPNQVYSNAHHNLMRVMIPEILGQTANLGEDDDTFRARVFGNYVEDVVFDAAGVSAWVAPPANPNLYYSFPDDGNGGVGTESQWIFLTDFGAYGWYLSAIDIVAVLSYINYTEDIISETMRNTMNQNEFGYWNSRTGDKGRYLMKQGGWAVTADGVSKGMQSIAAHFPGGVDAAVIVNSRIAPAHNMANLLRDAFDASFETP